MMSCSLSLSFPLYPGTFLRPLGLNPLGRASYPVCASLRGEDQVERAPASVATLENAVPRSSASRRVSVLPRPPS